jgi:hypothetical protein
VTDPVQAAAAEPIDRLVAAVADLAHALSHCENLPLPVMETTDEVRRAVIAFKASRHG